MTGKQNATRLGRTARTQRLVASGTPSDGARWSRQIELSQGWDERTEILASLISDGESVLEFGAGRMILRDLLPDGCSYIATDLVDRGPGTIVCDLNSRPLPSFPQADVAVFGGVLEYLRQPIEVIAAVTKDCASVVLSYADRVAFPGWLRRRRHGWISDLSSDELVDSLASCRLQPSAETSWKGQIIYRLDRVS